MSAPADLQTFLRHLESTDDLVSIRCEVDPYLEAAAVIDKVCKLPGGGKALLFENVKGSAYPLVANTFGSMKRIALSLGVSDVELLLKKVVRELSAFQGVKSDQVLKQLVANANCRKPTNQSADEILSRTECRLTDLPILHSWPGDGGKYLTLAQVFTSLPGASQQNCGMYRIQLVDERRALLRCHSGSGGAKHLKAWCELGEPMPVAIVLGGPPALTWASGVSLPHDIEETEFLTWLTGQRVSMSHCLRSELKIPTTAEVVIEGTIFSGVEMLEGPFGNHTGYYSKKSPAPVINIDSVTVRNDAVYPCTVVGPPPMENVYLARAMERLLLPLLKHDCPWVVDVAMPNEGIYHRTAFVAVDRTEHDTQEIAKILRSSQLLRNSRLILLLDEDVDLNACKEVYWKLINAGAWTENVLIDKDMMLVDARGGAERHRLLKDEDVTQRVSRRWHSLLAHMLSK